MYYHDETIDDAGKPEEERREEKINNLLITATFSYDVRKLSHLVTTPQLP